MTSFPDLLLDHDGPLCVVTLHRPKVLNALNASVISQLGQALTQIAGRADVRAVLLTGAGDRAFVAGADIAAMAALSPTEAQEFSRQGHELGSIMATLPQPIIAVINGFALGGGLELALACDMLLASKTAKLGLPEVSLSVIPGFGGTQRLIRRVGPGHAARLIYTGDAIAADEALRIGLVDGVVEGPALLEEAKTLGRKIATRGPLAVAAAKRALRAAHELSLAEGNLLEQRLFGQLFASQDQKEGMAAFLAKRPPTFTGR